MLDSLPAILPLLIPILALLIGLVVVGGIVVVQPLIKAITRLADAQLTASPGRPELEGRRIEDRLARLEVAIERLAEAHDFERQLHAGETGTTVASRNSQTSTDSGRRANG